MTNVEKTEKCIKAVYPCTRALMSLSFRNYMRTSKDHDTNARINDKYRHNNNY